MNEPANIEDEIYEIELSHLGLTGLMSPYLFGAKRGELPKSLNDSLQAAGASLKAFSLRHSVLEKVRGDSESGIVVAMPELANRCLAGTLNYVPLALIPKWSKGEWQAIEHERMITLRTSEYEFCTFAWGRDQEQPSCLSSILRWAGKQARPLGLCAITTASSPSGQGLMASEIAQELALPWRIELLKPNAKMSLSSRQIMTRLPRFTSRNAIVQSETRSSISLGSRITLSMAALLKDWRLSLPLAIALAGAALIGNPPGPISQASIAQKPASMPSDSAKSPVWRQVERLALAAHEAGVQDLQRLRLSREEGNISRYTVRWDWPASILGQSAQRPPLRSHQFELDANSIVSSQNALTVDQWQVVAADRGVLLEFSTSAQSWQATGPAQPISRITGFLSEVLEPHGSWRDVELIRTQDGLARIRITGAQQ